MSLSSVESEPTLQQLSVAQIQQSSEVRGWLSQFSPAQRPVAGMLLSRLRFVSRDEFSSWLQRAIRTRLNAEARYALFSVRKLEQGQQQFWDDEGIPVHRSGRAQGSEDLVYSVISNAVRGSNGSLLNHPSLPELRDKKVRHYCLIDDSIGSGDRVTGFINTMLTDPAFLSWWSFGWVRITILSFIRSRQAEKTIIAKIRGSNHSKRKIPKSAKVSFVSKIVYDVDEYELRWGSRYQEIIHLCSGETRVNTRWRKGYGNTMANTVFYHSVPNNIPGILWCQNKRWQGLMPGRALPPWMQVLLGSQSSIPTKGPIYLPADLLTLMTLAKRGVRDVRTIAARLSVDHQYAKDMIANAVKLGLLTERGRLTRYGEARLIQLSAEQPLAEWDRSLYIPSSWCVDQR